MDRLERVLVRDGKKVTLAVMGTSLEVKGDKPSTEDLDTERAAAERLVELSRTRLGQGWTPASKPDDVGAFASALRAARLSAWDFVVAFDDAELTHFYEQAMHAESKDLTLEVLRRRPTRELFAWMLQHFDAYYVDDWTKAVKFLAKTPENAAWIQEELRAALETGSLPNAAKKFAERNAKRIAAGPKAAPVAPGAAKGNEKDLLADVARAPANDAPRLVYADWLLEQGNGFGELIQVSCKLALLDDGHPERDELAARLKKLEAKHAKAWLAPIRPFIRSWSFERGLLSNVVCDAALFTQAADAIALRAPRARIELTGLKKKDIGALAGTPLGAFAWVCLDQQRIDDAGMVALASSPTVAGASSWNLSYNLFKDQGLRALAESPHWTSVEELTLRAWQPQFGAGALAALLGSPRLSNLQELEITATAATNAFAGCRLPLRSLSLRVQSFTNEDASQLARALGGHLEALSLERLFDDRFELDDAAVNALLDRLPKLRSFQTNVELRKATTERIATLRTDSRPSPSDG